MFLMLLLLNINFINFKCINFLFWQVKCRSPCFAVHRYYFHNFRLLNSFSDYVFRKYEIVNIFENDSDAIHSRLLYVQNRELVANTFPFNYFCYIFIIVLIPCSCYYKLLHIYQFI